jgi:hypothetical protein
MKENYTEIMVPKGNYPEASDWLESNGFVRPEFIARCLHIQGQ